jgi:hypothetical protein
VGGAVATFNMWATEEGMLEYSLNVTDIVDLTMSHIHVGNATTENGAIIVQLVPEASSSLAAASHTACQPLCCQPLGFPAFDSCSAVLTLDLCRTFNSRCCHQLCLVPSVSHGELLAAITASTWCCPRAWLSLNKISCNRVKVPAHTARLILCSATINTSSLTGMTLPEFLDAADSQGLYIVLHTRTYPDGAIRGQIMPGEPTRASYRSTAFHGHDSLVFAPCCLKCKAVDLVPSARLLAMPRPLLQRPALISWRT